MIRIQLFPEPQRLDLGHGVRLQLLPLTTALMVATRFFAGRFVVAIGAAALGISGLSLSLTVLKGALVRTGIGALIVGAGELVYRFSKLVEGAGGWRPAHRGLGSDRVMGGLGFQCGNVGRRCLDASGAAARLDSLEHRRRGPHRLERHGLGDCWRIGRVGRSVLLRCRVRGL